MPRDVYEPVEKEQVPARVEVVLMNKVRAAARQSRRTLGAELSLIIEEGFTLRAQQSKQAKSRERITP